MEILLKELELEEHVETSLTELLNAHDVRIVQLTQKRKTEKTD